MNVSTVLPLELGTHRSYAADHAGPVLLQRRLSPVQLGEAHPQSVALCSNGAERSVIVRRVEFAGRERRRCGVVAPMVADVAQGSDDAFDVGGRRGGALAPHINTPPSPPASS